MSEKTDSSNKYYMLHAKGDSINQLGINAGNLMLVRQQTTAKHGDIVVVLIDNKVTIKEYTSTESVRDFMIQGVVVTTINDG